jgi:hypothetical protein
MTKKNTTTKALISKIITKILNRIPTTMSTAKTSKPQDPKTILIPLAVDPKMKILGPENANRPKNPEKNPEKNQRNPKMEAAAKMGRQKKWIDLPIYIQ